MKKFFKLFGWSLLIALIVIQFFQPEKNESVAYSGHRITDAYKLTDDVQEVLSVSCYDCHSNNTRPMFYMKIQPVGMWVMHHVEEGKDELNFDEFGAYTLRRQYHKLEEIIEMVNEDEMPLYSYTLMHGDATLDEAKKKVLVDWAGNLMDTLEAHYPMDSLVSKQ
jgi:cbb3-type cytochrome oxidase cytochrome c subunit